MSGGGLRTVAVIQARMSSSRLPGKVLAPIAGRPAILLMAERVQRALRVDALCVATSVDPSDDPLAACLAEAGIPAFRGSLDDVLARFAGAARACQADLVVRLTGDCPLIDADIVDRVAALVEGGCAYASNVDPPTFPDGLDVEAMRMDVLDAADREARLDSEREHVTPFIRNRRGRFPAGSLLSAADLSALRWTVDYPDDLAFVRRLAEAVDDPIVADRFDFLRALERIEAADGPTHSRNEGLVASLARDAADPPEG